MSPLVTPDEERELQAFVFDEACLLDERRFEAWLALFAEDGVYWVPAQHDQTSPTTALSLYYEAKPLLALRVARLAQPSMHAQSPPSRTHHHVGAVRIAREGDAYVVDASLIMAEHREGETRWFAGRTHHRIVRTAEGLRIALKRVNLVDCEAPQRALAVPF